MRRLIAIALLTAATGAGGTALGAALPGDNPRPTLATDLAVARDATARYANGLGRARADGYRILTRMIPDMGYHYLNPSVKGFDLRRPPILVYERRGAKQQLAALEWVFPKRPPTPPIPGAQYGSFGAACHYADGTLVFAGARSKCAPTSPQTGAAFGFWHGPLVTLHVWLWYPNPSGLYASMNPLVTPYNGS
jgi:hypothetical protein